MREIMDLTKGKYCTGCGSTDIRQTVGAYYDCNRCGWRMMRMADGNLQDRLPIITAGKRGKEPS